LLKKNNIDPRIKQLKILDKSVAMGKWNFTNNIEIQYRITLPKPPPKKIYRNFIISFFLTYSYIIEQQKKQLEIQKLYHIAHPLDNVLLNKCDYMKLVEPKPIKSI